MVFAVHRDFVDDGDNDDNDDGTDDDDDDNARQVLSAQCKGLELLLGF